MLSLLFAFAQGELRLELAQTLVPEFEVSDQRLIGLASGDDSGPRSLVLLGARGEVRVFAHDGAIREAGVLSPAGTAALQLADPARALVDLARLRRGQGLDLLVLGPKDTRVFARQGESFAGEGVLLARRATHSLRVGAPRFVDVAQDVNGDGCDDLVVPSATNLKLWLSSAPAAGGDTPWPTFAQTATLAVEVEVALDVDSAQLSDLQSSEFAIPSIVARDVNGDDRADLLVSQGSLRAFHLQAADTTFPEAPSVRVDLSIFRDTLEQAEIRPGHTLAVDDSASYQLRDLDGDKIMDCVIAHRRKVWVFHGTSAGPQFKEPSTILKTSDDITALQLIRLDDDTLPDLLLVKVQVPTIATLVRGIFGEWDVQVSAVGYLSKDGRSFESTPSKRAELAVRLPAILKLMKNPASFLKRFEEVGARFRRSVWGDFDGNGTRDVVLAGGDGVALELWLSDAGEAASSGSFDGESLLNQILFEDAQRVWDLERIATWLGSLADRRTAVLTGGKPSNEQFPIRPQAEASLVGMDAGDLDGDGRAELLLSYKLIPSGARAFDILRLVRD